MLLERVTIQAEGAATNEAPADRRDRVSARAVLGKETGLERALGAYRSGKPRLAASTASDDGARADMAVSVHANASSPPAVCLRRMSQEGAPFVKA